MDGPLDTLAAGRSFPAVGAIYTTRDLPAPRANRKIFRASTERHKEREIYVQMSGRNRFVFNDTPITVNPGDAFLIDRWELHSFAPAPTIRRQVQLWVHVHERNIFATMVGYGPGAERRCGAMKALSLPVLDLVNQRWDLLDSVPADDDRHALIKRSMVVTLLDDFVLTRAERDFKEKARLNISDFIKRHIEHTCGRNSSLAELSQLTGYHACYLARIFRSECGCTIGEYKNQVRQGIVRVALARGISQKELSYQLGFSSAAAFWRWKHKNM